jgi:hypothetical protein
MASKRRKSYSGTPREHAQDARYHAKEIRGFVKRARFELKAGRCERAAEDLVRLATREGQYTDARYYGAKNRFQTRYNMHKTVDSLTRRFIQKCVR